MNTKAKLAITAVVAVGLGVGVDPETIIDEWNNDDDNLKSEKEKKEDTKEFFTKVFGGDLFGL